MPKRRRSPEQMLYAAIVRIVKSHDRRAGKKKGGKK